MKSLRVLIVALLPLSAGAGDLTTDAAIGGAIGGALGGAVGAEVGGREGAVIGAGVGAAAGTAVSTRDHAERDDHYHEEGYRQRDYDDRYHDHHNRPGSFCPPGQAKKGRC